VGIVAAHVEAAFEVFLPFVIRIVAGEIRVFVHPFPPLA
jgi:hypothetical protein